MKKGTILTLLFTFNLGIVFGQLDVNNGLPIVKKIAARQIPNLTKVQTLENRPTNFFDTTKAVGLEAKSTVGTLAVTNPFITGDVYCSAYYNSTYLHANPSSGYTYQWSFSLTETGTFTDIPDATQSYFASTTNINTGYYKVAINDGSTPVLSAAYYLRQGFAPTITTATGVNPATIASGESIDLNINYLGALPYKVTLWSGYGYGAPFREYIVNTAASTITVAPDVFKSYYLGDVADINGKQCSNGSLLNIYVTPTPSLLLPTPSNTTVCAGNIIELPITKVGAWGSPDNQKVGIALKKTAGGFVNNSYNFNVGQNGNVLSYLVPLGTPVGTYYIYTFGISPNTNELTSDYAITVSNTGCSTKQALIAGKESGCNPYLEAFPQGYDYTYQWYKNNIAMPNEIYYNLIFGSNATSGSYSVVVKSNMFSFSATSPPKIVSVNSKPILSMSNNGLLCVGGGTNTITANFITTSGSSYQWYKNTYMDYVETNIPLFGETGTSLTVSSPGNYYLSVWNGSCQVQSDIVVVRPCVTCVNPILCSSNTQIVLQASPNSSISGYQWLTSNTEFGIYTNIIGATGSTYTATNSGFYKVKEINSGVLSDALKISNTPYAVLLNPSGTTDPINIPLGGTAAITFKLYGTPPFSLQINDGLNNRFVFSATNQITLNFNPLYRTSYYISTITDAGCSRKGFSTGQNMVVNVGTPPSFTLGTISSTICSGEVITIPYTMMGTYENNVVFSAKLYNVNLNSYVTNTSNSSTNPLQLQIPSDMPLGTYKIEVSPNSMQLNSQFTSSFSVTATSCTPTTQASIHGNSSACYRTELTALPKGLNYLYQWYKDEAFIEASYSPILSVTQSGNYTVKVTNSSNGYNSTSSPKNILINSATPVINSSNLSLCGVNSSVTLTTPFAGAGYTYQWLRFDPVKFIKEAVAGQNSPTITLTQPSEVGYYSVAVFDGVCDNNSNDVPVSISTTVQLLNSSGNINSVYLTPGQTENLQLNLGGQSPWTYTFNGSIYSTNASPVIIPVTPTISGYYQVINVLSSGTACVNNGMNSSSIYFNVKYPCPSLLNLVSPTDDAALGLFVKEANAISGTIISTNKITSTAKVIYRAGKSLIFNPGFQTEQGVVFKTEFGGCN